MSKKANCIEALHYEKILIDERLERVYKDVFNDCFTQMKIEKSKGSHFCLFRVPEFYINEEHYNIVDCLYYIVRKLKKEGCQANYVYPNFVHIVLLDNEEEAKRQLKLKYLCMEDFKSRYIYSQNGTLIPKVTEEDTKRIAYDMKNQREKQKRFTGPSNGRMLNREQPRQLEYSMSLKNEYTYSQQPEEENKPIRLGGNININYN